MTDLTLNLVTHLAAEIIEPQPGGTLADYERMLNACGTVMQYTIQRHIEGTPWLIEAGRQTNMWLWYPAACADAWTGEHGDWRPHWQFKPLARLDEAYRVACAWLNSDADHNALDTQHPVPGRPTWLFIATIAGKYGAQGTFYGEHANHARALLEAILSAHIGRQLRLVDDAADDVGGAA